MSVPRIRVLLVEDDEDDYVLTRELLEEIEGAQFDLQWAGSLNAGRRELTEGGHDVCLVDFHLGEGNGIDLLREMVERGVQTPLILLTGQNDRKTDLEAMRSGATDYLVKGEITAPVLERAIRYACERHRLLEQIRTMSLMDELTGVHNRRGFFTLAEQQIRIAERKERNTVLLFADLDGMKEINDRFGHQEGDSALIEAARVLRATFRQTDVVARLGGDEFVMLGVEACPGSAEIMVSRLIANIEASNAAPDRAYPLSMSTGCICYNPTHRRTLDSLLAEADALMYAQKQARKRHNVAACSSAE
ncbi:MAG: GGDEF domain-containing response regulator [Gemmatimonadetes bacterium]|nr:GGDEF domain-containing response regulator [Gemmatimonadota bacterium]